MKESKKTPVPLPGSKSKFKAKDTPSKALLSQEFIESGDDSPAEKTPRPTKPKTTISIHKPNGPVKAKPNTSANGSTTSTLTLNSQSSKKSGPNLGVSRAQSAESSSSEQSDVSDTPARDIEFGSLRNEKGTPSSANASDTSSDSSSDESSTDKVSLSNRKHPQEQPQSSKTQSHSVEFLAAQPYVPPRGFNPIPFNNKTTSKAATIFDNLQGKQVWHFTAPAGVPLKDLRELVMDRALDGEAVLNYKGAEYAFSKAEASEDGAREVLVPQVDGYKAVSARISQTLHLQAVVRLPKLSSRQAELNTSSETAVSITRSTIRAPRPQVKGLKMRFLPTGFGGDALCTLGDSDSDVEVSQQSASRRLSNGLDLPYRKEKRKHVDTNDIAKELSSKKSRKHRAPEEIKRKEERRAKKEKKRAQEAALIKS